jgi:hypothetical protein
MRIRLALQIALFPFLAPANLIDFEIVRPGRVSLGIFDKESGLLHRTLLNAEAFEPGKHRITWDGLDQRGRPVPSGKYEWSSLQTPGFTARYLTTLGINPPGGEHAIPKKSWVGDHNGAGFVEFDDSGLYVGSPITEGGMMVVKVSHTLDSILWRRPQFYQGGRLSAITATGDHFFMLHPDGKLRRLNKSNGHVEKEWDGRWEKQPATALDGRGQNLVAVYPSRNALRWISPDDGTPGPVVTIPSVTGVAAINDQVHGTLYASAGKDLFLVTNGKPEKVHTFPLTITALEYDPGRKQLWLVLG